jgi:O-acetylhomoserine (thiol)-lyase
VTFGYEDARQLAEVFQGKQPGYRYGRQGNPTVSALEDKITKMEDGKSTICFATGMGAIGAVQGCCARATMWCPRLSCSVIACG